MEPKKAVRLKNKKKLNYHYIILDISYIICLRRQPKYEN